MFNWCDLKLIDLVNFYPCCVCYKSSQIIIVIIIITVTTETFLSRYMLLWGSCYNWSMCLSVAHGPLLYSVFYDLIQGSHSSWKVLDFFLKIPGPGKSWKSTLVLESPGNWSLMCWKVLEKYPWKLRIFYWFYWKQAEIGTLTVDFDGKNCCSNLCVVLFCPQP